MTWFDVDEAVKKLKIRVATPANPAIPANLSISISEISGISNPPDPEMDEILGMPLSAFAQSGEWLRIRSALLDEDIVFAADNATGLPEGIPAYRASEIPGLMKQPPEDIWTLHRVKVIFNGRMEAVSSG